MTSKRPWKTSPLTAIPFSRVPASYLMDGFNRQSQDPPKGVSRSVDSPRLRYTLLVLEGAGRPSVARHPVLTPRDTQGRRSREHYRQDVRAVGILPNPRQVVVFLVEGSRTERHWPSIALFVRPKMEGRTRTGGQYVPCGARCSRQGVQPTAWHNHRTDDFSLPSAAHPFQHRRRVKRIALRLHRATGLFWVVARNAFPGRSWQVNDVGSALVRPLL